MQVASPAVPTQTAIDMLRIQAIWLWNHSAIVVASLTGLWKLSRSIKKLPEKITAPLSIRQDAHEKLDNERETSLRNAISEAGKVAEERWDSLKFSVDQINASLSRLVHGQQSGD